MAKRGLPISGRTALQPGDDTVADSRSKPRNLSEAIETLENSTRREHRKGDSDSDSDELKSVRDAIADLKPHLEKFKEDMQSAARSAFEEPLKKGKQQAEQWGNEIDQKVHENPWMALGIVGMICFLIGFLLGRKD